jgi:hypothetical protein
MTGPREQRRPWAPPPPLSLRVRHGDGRPHALSEMVVEKLQCHRLQCPGSRRDLRQDVDLIVVLPTRRCRRLTCPSFRRNLRKIASLSLL